MTGDTKTEDILQPGEYAECVDNVSCENQLTNGNAYRIVGLHGDSCYRIKNDKWTEVTYFRSRFIRCNPPSLEKSVEDREYVSLNPRAEVWSTGDLIECEAPDNPYTQEGSRHTVEMFISGWDRTKGDVSTVKVYGIEDFIDVRDFKRICKARQNEAPAHGFWMVKGEGPTSYEHASEESADIEAKRLAKEHRGHVFTVLGPIRSYVTSELQCHDLSKFLESGEDKDGDVPF